MKSTSLSAVVAALALSLLALIPVNEASAQGGVRVGSHVGVNFEGTDFLIGLNSHFGFTAGEQKLMGNPSIDFYLFEDNVSIYRINLDVLLPFVAGTLNPFVGAGLGFQVIKFDENIPALGGTTDSDVALNLRLGSFFGNPESAFRPFADLALSVGDGTSVSARVGASFGITG